MVKCVTRFTWHLEIAREDGRTFKENFTTRVRLVSDHVLHIGKTLHSQFNGFDGASDMARDAILGHHKGARGRRLRQPVALQNRAREADLEEVNDLLVNWCGACKHLSYLATEHASGLAEEKRVIASVSDCTCCLKIGLLGCQAAVQEPSFAPSECFKACLERAEDLVVEARDRGEDNRLQSCAVLHQFYRITLIEANL